MAGKKGKKTPAKRVLSPRSCKNSSQLCKKKIIAKKAVRNLAITESFIANKKDQRKCREKASDAIDKFSANDEVPSPSEVKNSIKESVTETLNANKRTPRKCQKDTPDAIDKSSKRDDNNASAQGKDSIVYSISESIKVNKRTPRKCQDTPDSIDNSSKKYENASPARGKDSIKDSISASLKANKRTPRKCQKDTPETTKKSSKKDENASPSRGKDSIKDSITEYLKENKRSPRKCLKDALDTIDNSSTKYENSSQAGDKESSKGSDVELVDKSKRIEPKAKKPPQVGDKRDNRKVCVNVSTPKELPPDKVDTTAEDSNEDMILNGQPLDPKKSNSHLSRNDSSKKESQEKKSDPRTNRDKESLEMEGHSLDIEGALNPGRSGDGSEITDVDGGTTKSNSSTDKNKISKEAIKKSENACEDDSISQMVCSKTDQEKVTLTKQSNLLDEASQKTLVLNEYERSASKGITNVKKSTKIQDQEENISGTSGKASVAVLKECFIKVKKLSELAIENSEAGTAPSSNEIADGTEDVAKEKNASALSEKVNAWVDNVSNVSEKIEALVEKAKKSGQVKKPKGKTQGRNKISSVSSTSSKESSPDPSLVQSVSVFEETDLVEKPRESSEVEKLKGKTLNENKISSITTTSSKEASADPSFDQSTNRSKKIDALMENVRKSGEVKSLKGKTQEENRNSNIATTTSQASEKTDALVEKPGKSGEVEKHNKKTQNKKKISSITTTISNKVLLDSSSSQILSVSEKTDASVEKPKKSAEVKKLKGKTQNENKISSIKTTSSYKASADSSSNQSLSVSEKSDASVVKPGKSAVVEKLKKTVSKNIMYSLTTTNTSSKEASANSSLSQSVMNVSEKVSALVEKPKKSGKVKKRKGKTHSENGTTSLSTTRNEKLADSSAGKSVEKKMTIIKKKDGSVRLQTSPPVRSPLELSKWEQSQSSNSVKTSSASSSSIPGTPTTSKISSDTLNNGKVKKVPIEEELKEKDEDGPWMTDAIRKQITIRNRTYNMFLKKRDEKLLNYYYRCKTRVQKLLEQAKQEYLDSQSNKELPGKLHRIVLIFDQQDSYLQGFQYPSALHIFSESFDFSSGHTCVEGLVSPKENVLFVVLCGIRTVLRFIVDSECRKESCSSKLYRIKPALTDSASILKELVSKALLFRKRVTEGKPNYRVVFSGLLPPSLYHIDKYAVDAHCRQCDHKAPLHSKEYFSAMNFVLNEAVKKYNHWAKEDAFVQGFLGWDVESCFTPDKSSSFSHEHEPDGVSLMPDCQVKRKEALRLVVERTNAISVPSVQEFSQSVRKVLNFIPTEISLVFDETEDFLNDVKIPCVTHLNTSNAHIRYQDAQVEILSSKSPKERTLYVVCGGLETILLFREDLDCKAFNCPAPLNRIELCSSTVKELLEQFITSAMSLRYNVEKITNRKVIFSSLLPVDLKTVDEYAVREHLRKCKHQARYRSKGSLEEDTRILAHAVNDFNSWARKEALKLGFCDWNVDNLFAGITVGSEVMFLPETQSDGRVLTRKWQEIKTAVVTASLKKTFDFINQVKENRSKEPPAESQEPTHSPGTRLLHSRVKNREFNHVVIVANTLYWYLLHDLQSPKVTIIVEEQLSFERIPYLVREHQRDKTQKTLWILPTGIYTLTEFYKHPLCSSCITPLHVLSLGQNGLPSQEYMESASKKLVEKAKIMERTIQDELDPESVVLFIPPISATVVVDERFENHTLLHKVCESNNAFATDAETLAVLREFYNHFCDKWKALVNQYCCDDIPSFSVITNYQTENHGGNVIPILEDEDYTFAVKIWKDMFTEFIKQSVSDVQINHTPFSNVTNHIEPSTNLMKESKVDHIICVGERNECEGFISLQHRLPITFVHESVEFTDDFAARCLSHPKNQLRTAWIFVPSFSLLTKKVNKGTYCSDVKCKEPFEYHESLIACAKGKGSDDNLLIQSFIDELLAKAKSFILKLVENVNAGSFICFMPMAPTPGMMVSPSTSHERIHSLKKESPSALLLLGQYSWWKKCATYLDKIWKNFLLENSSECTFHNLLVEYYKQQIKCLDFVYSVHTINSNKELHAKWSSTVTLMLVKISTELRVPDKDPPVGHFSNPIVLDDSDDECPQFSPHVSPQISPQISDDDESPQPVVELTQVDPVIHTHAQMLPDKVVTSSATRPQSEAPVVNQSKSQTSSAALANPPSSNAESIVSDVKIISTQEKLPVLSADSSSVEQKPIVLCLSVTAAESKPPAFSPCKLTEQKPLVSCTDIKPPISFTEVKPPMSLFSTVKKEPGIDGSSGTSTVSGNEKPVENSNSNSKVSSNKVDSSKKIDRPAEENMQQIEVRVKEEPGLSLTNKFPNVDAAVRKPISGDNVNLANKNTRSTALDPTGNVLNIKSSERSKVSFTLSPKSKGSMSLETVGKEPEAVNRKAVNENEKSNAEMTVAKDLGEQSEKSSSNVRSLDKSCENVSLTKTCSTEGGCSSKSKENITGESIANESKGSSNSDRDQSELGNAERLVESVVNFSKDTNESGSLDSASSNKSTASRNVTTSSDDISKSTADIEAYLGNSSTEKTTFALTTNILSSNSKQAIEDLTVESKTSSDEIHSVGIKNPSSVNFSTPNPLVCTTNANPSTKIPAPTCIVHPTTVSTNPPSAVKDSTSDASKPPQLSGSGKGILTTTEVPVSSSSAQKVSATSTTKSTPPLKAVSHNEGIPTAIVTPKVNLQKSTVAKPSSSKSNAPSFPVDTTTRRPQKSMEATYGIVFVNLSKSVKEEHMKKLAAACGPVHSMMRPTDVLGKPQEHGWVKYFSCDVALRAVKVFSAVILAGKPLQVRILGTYVQNPNECVSEADRALYRELKRIACKCKLSLKLRKEMLIHYGETETSEKESTGVNDIKDQSEKISKKRKADEDADSEIKSKVKATGNVMDAQAPSTPGHKTFSSWRKDVIQRSEGKIFGGSSWRKDVIERAEGSAMGNSWRKDVIERAEGKAVQGKWKPIPTLNSSELKKPSVSSAKKIITDETRVRVSNLSLVMPSEIVDRVFLACGALDKGEDVKNPDGKVFRFPSYKSALLAETQLKGLRLLDKILQVKVMNHGSGSKPALRIEEEMSIRNNVLVILKDFEDVMVAVAKALAEIGTNVYSFKTQICTKGNCTEIRLCPDYHSDEDKRRDPLIYDYGTTMCCMVQNGKACNRQDDCEYAHSALEVLFHTTKFRSNICIQWAQFRACPMNDQICPFAHPGSPDLFFHPQWENLYIEGLHNTLSFLSGAILNHFRLLIPGSQNEINNDAHPSIHHVRILVVTPSAEMAKLYTQAVKELALSCNINVAAVNLGSDTPDSSVLIGTPASLSKLFAPVNTQASARSPEKTPKNISNVKAIILDDISSMLPEFSDISKHQALKKLMRTQGINKVAVSEEIDVRGVEAQKVGRLFSSKLKELPLRKQSHTSTLQISQLFEAQAQMVPKREFPLLHADETREDTPSPVLQILPAAKVVPGPIDKIHTAVVPKNNSDQSNECGPLSPVSDTETILFNSNRSPSQSLSPSPPPLQPLWTNSHGSEQPSSLRAGSFSSRNKSTFSQQGNERTLPHPPRNSSPFPSSSSYAKERKPSHSSREYSPYTKSPYRGYDFHNDERSAHCSTKRKSSHYYDDDRRSYEDGWSSDEYSTRRHFEPDAHVRKSRSPDLFPIRSEDDQRHESLSPDETSKRRRRSSRHRSPERSSRRRSESLERSPKRRRHSHSNKRSKHDRSKRKHHKHHKCKKHTLKHSRSSSERTRETPLSSILLKPESDDEPCDKVVERPEKDPSCDEVIECQSPSKEVSARSVEKPRKDATDVLCNTCGVTFNPLTDVEYLGVEKTLEEAHAKEFKIFLDNPEIHPDYEASHSKFEQYFKKRFGDDSSEEQHGSMWNLFWEELIRDQEKEEWAGKREGLLKQFEIARKRLCKCSLKPKESVVLEEISDSSSDSSDIVIISENLSNVSSNVPSTSSSSTAIASGSSELPLSESLNLLGEVCNSLGEFLGSLMNKVIARVKEFSDTRKAFQFLGEADTIKLLQMSAEKIRNASVKAEGAQKTKLFYCRNFINKLIAQTSKTSVSSTVDITHSVRDIMNKETSILNTIGKTFKIDVTRLARETMNKEPSVVLNTIKDTLKRHGMIDPSRETVRQIYSEVSEWHLKTTLDNI